MDFAKHEVHGFSNSLFFKIATCSPPPPLRTFRLFPPNRAVGPRKGREKDAHITCAVGTRIDAVEPRSGRGRAAQIGVLTRRRLPISGGVKNLVGGKRK